MLSKGLDKASLEALTDDEAMELKEIINKSPETVLEILEPSMQSFMGFLTHNLVFLRETILPLLLSSPLREEYSDLRIC